MKAPVLLGSAILVCFFAWSVRHGSTLAELRQREGILHQQARELGVSDDLSKPFTPVRAKRGGDVVSDATKVGQVADRLIAHLERERVAKEAGNNWGDERQADYLDTFDALYSLHAAELQLLYETFKERSDLDESYKSNLLNLTLVALGREHPAGALSIIIESEDLLKSVRPGEGAFHSSLRNWANDQPDVAAAWLQAHGEKLPEKMRTEAQTSIILGIADTDYAAAFDMMNRMQPSLPLGTVLNTPGFAPRTLERASEMFEAFQHYQEAMPGREEAAALRTRLATHLFSHALAGRAKDAIPWLEKMELNTAEATAAVNSLNSRYYFEDGAQWMDWISSIEQKPSPEASARYFQNWTREDTQAAAEWLDQAPAGPIKDAATLAYIETIAPYDRGEAIQRAEALPAGQRERALEVISKAGAAK
jgi:hypothetical protein